MSIALYFEKTYSMMLEKEKNSKPFSRENSFRAAFTLIVLELMYYF
jgi:hypothetical protein